MAGDFTVNRGAAQSIAASPKVQRDVRRAAEAGAAVFRARAVRLTGQYAGDVRVEACTGWDGRPGSRIVSYAPATLSQTFGAYGRRGDPALQAAAAAAGQRPGSGKKRRR